MQKISIITPSLNQGKYIQDTIESVRSQNYPAIEHIVIDGGSTDDTVEILKQYPHLIWESAKDRGQSHALNKGFQKATGDIITWLNADDWYAENIFEDVVDALNKQPIIMGACELRDELNRRMYVVPNSPRTWFDLIKYWVPYSIPAQPSIFMRRDFLELVRRPDGSFFDEELFYCMDYDLWLRLCQHTPLSLSLGKILSYYRMTSENKTGQQTEGMPYAEPEMSRLFNRYKDSPLNISFPLTVIVSADEKTPLQEILNSLSKQSLPIGEVLVTMYGEAEKTASIAKEICSQLNVSSRDSQIDFYFRLVPGIQTTCAAALNEAARLSSGSILAFLVDGVPPPSDLITTVLKYFSSDRVGVVDFEHSKASFATRSISFFEVGGIGNIPGMEQAVSRYKTACEQRHWTHKKAWNSR